MLPEKFAIKRTEENHTVVNNWLNEGTNQKEGYTQSEEYVLYPNTSTDSGFKSGYHIDGRIPKGYVEISFEEFQKYVLNIECSYSIY